MDNKTTNESALTAELMITSREHENKDRKDISKLIQLISSSKEVEKIKNHLRGMNDIARNRSMMIIRKREPKLYSDITESADKKSMYQQHIDLGKKLSLTYHKNLNTLGENHPETKKAKMLVDDHYRKSAIQTAIGKYNESYIEEDNKMEKDKDPCWKKYKMVGMKKKNDKMVPNCVPEAKELHPNQQKLDVYEPEKDELTAKDFAMLRKMKKKKIEEASLDEMTIKDIRDKLKSGFAFLSRKPAEMPSAKEIVAMSTEETPEQRRERLVAMMKAQSAARSKKAKSAKPAGKQMEAKELHPNQQKLDVHEPEKDELTSKDFAMLRKMKKKKIEEVVVPKGVTPANRVLNKEELKKIIPMTKNPRILGGISSEQLKRENQERRNRLGYTPNNESVEYLEEKEMTDAQKAKREKYVLAMKKKMDSFEKRYGDRAMDVIYATATKMAMKESVTSIDEMADSEYTGEIDGITYRVKAGTERAALEKILSRHMSTVRGLGKLPDRKELLDSIKLGQPVRPGSFGSKLPTLQTKLPGTGLAKRVTLKDHVEIDEAVPPEGKALMTPGKKTGNAAQPLEFAKQYTPKKPTVLTTENPEYTQSIKTGILNRKGRQSKNQEDIPEMPSKNPKRFINLTMIKQAIRNKLTRNPSLPIMDDDQ